MTDEERKKKAADVLKFGGNPFSTTAETFGDPDIFTDEARKECEKLGNESDQIRFVSGLIRQFYDERPAFAKFQRDSQVSNPVKWLEFFQNIKNSHIKRAGIDPEKFKALQKRLKETEIYYAKNPLPEDPKYITLKDIGPLLHCSYIFTEYELAELYYLQHPDEVIKQHYDIIPTGPYTTQLDELVEHLAAGRDLLLDLTSDGLKKNDRRKQYITKRDGDIIRSTTKKGPYDFTISLLDSKLIKSVSVQKLFDFLLIKANESNFAPEFFVSYDELVEAGLYSNVNSARVGFDTHILGVQSIQINGTIKQGRKVVDDSGGVLFYSHRHTTGGEIIGVFTQNNMIELLGSNYAALPKWSFGLTNNGYMLLKHIYIYARTNRKTIFNISLKTVREWLSLPTREQYKTQRAGKQFKPKKMIVDPINDALEDIKARQQEERDHSLTIERHFTDSDKIETWLNDGFITVTLKDPELIRKVATIEKQRRKYIDEAKEKAKEKAKK